MARGQSAPEGWQRPLSRVPLSVLAHMLTRDGLRSVARRCVRPRAGFPATLVLAAGLGLPGARPAIAQAPRAASTDTLRRALVRTDDGLAARTRQTLTMSGTIRRYRVGTTTVGEDASPLAWRLVSPHVAARLSGTPLSLEATGITVRGTTPIRARIDVVPRAGDTLSVYARSGSGPRTLDSTQALAVGAAGTAVLDLSSLTLGVAPQVGMRGRWSFPVGNVVLGLSAAAERDLPPSATGVVYWQGTTLRGGASVTGFVSEQTVVASVDLSTSRADSLGGRNQFPGGGAVTLSASTSGALDEDGTRWFAGDAFYVRPFGNDRNDQPTRLIPQGSFGGVSGLLLLESGALTWTPTVSLMREASTATLAAQQGGILSRTALSSSAWTIAGSLSVDIPVGGAITLSPEVGAVGGTVSSTLAQTTGRVLGRRGRVVNVTNTSGFADPVRGWWSGVAISVRY